MLAIADNYRGLHSIVAAGNEAGKAHHYYGSFSGDETSTDVANTGTGKQLWILCRILE